jgi:REP element-mobilizing transposase RayT
MKKRTSPQLEFGFVNWGGKRRGAGRKPKGERAGVPHVKRPRLSGREPVSVTLRFVAGLLSFRADDTHALLVAAMRGATRDDFRVCAYSIRSNHMHLVVEASDARALSRGMNSLGTRIGMAVNKLWKRRGPVLAERYHSRVLRSPTEVRRALVYVLNNARKHGAWIAPRPDPYSSGPSFDGWRTGSAGAHSTPSLGSRVAPLVPPASVQRPPPCRADGARWSDAAVSPPRTWLLTLGWRRLGLIDVRELPANSRASAAG